MQTLDRTKPEGSTAQSRHVAVALCSLAAAGIHFAAVGDHLELHLLHGMFFIVVAWAQALWALGILVAPRRELLIAGLVGNAAVVITWAFSRTTGLPVPPNVWTTEALGTADVVATAFELVIIVWCAFALRRPVASSGGAFDDRAPLPVIVVSVAVLSGIAIGLGGGHSHVGGDGHEGDGHVSMVAAGAVNPEQIEMIDKAMSRYANVDTAFAQGWESEHEDWPEIGSHFYRDGDWNGPYPTRPGIDIFDPEFLMYTRLLSGDEWELIAVAYVADMAVYESPPPEISGAEYHTHVWTCVVDGEELEEDEYGPISEPQCETMGGVWDPGGVWMTHVWFIDNPLGIFAESNPDVVPLAS